MLKINLNLIPRGVHIEEKKLYTITITNCGIKKDKGNYKIKFKNNLTNKIKEIKIDNFNRVKDDSLKLLYKSLKKLYNK